LNFSWSVLVFLTGVLVVRAALLGPESGSFVRAVVFTIGLFWVIHGIYTWVNPFPMPRSLQALQFALGAFPAVVVILHWLPLALFRASSMKPANSLG